MQIKRKALYLEAIDILVQHIQEGKYPPGAKLPSEEQLAREMGISRVTLREALRVLSEDGILVSPSWKRNIRPRQKGHAGSGSFHYFVHFHHVCKSRFGASDCQGRLPQNPGKPESRGKIADESGEEVWEIERLRAIGGKPAMYSLDYFPAALVPPGGEERIKDYLFSTYYFLSEVCGQKIEQGRCNLKPILADEKLQEIMKVPRNTPVMYIEIVDLNPEEKPISIRTGILLCGFF